METEIIVGLVIAVIGLIGIIIKEYFANKRLKEELKIKEEEIIRKYQSKQQEMALKQNRQIEIEKSKKDRAAMGIVKEFIIKL